VVASSKRTGRMAQKNYVPSAEQRADDVRLRKEFENLTDADVKKFERTLGRAIRPLRRIGERKQTIRGYTCEVILKS
jgi:hypothetical protein